MLSPDMAPSLEGGGRELCQHKMERKILGEIMKDNVRNTDDGKRTSL